MSKISVIVPVYQVEEYLSRCVDSILAQSYRDFELILIDDGSPDRCGEICDEYAKKDIRVTVIHKKNGGLSSARNAGLDLALSDDGSEWITFIDSDDWVHYSYLETLLKLVLSQNTKIAMCEMMKTEVFVSDEQTECSFRVITPTEALYKTGHFEIEAYSCGKLYHKSIFQKVRFPEGMVFEDFYLIPEIVLKETGVAKCDAQLYYYYQRQGSTVYSINRKSMIDKWKGYEHILEICKKTDNGYLYDIMSKAYLFWACDRVNYAEDLSTKKLIRKKGRKLVFRFHKEAGLPFHFNKDLMKEVYPGIWKVYLLFHRIKNFFKGNSGK